MVNTPGSTFGGGPEKKVGGIIVPESLQEQKEALRLEVVGRAKKIADFENQLATDSPKPVNELDTFRQKSRQAEALADIRKSTVSILTKTPDVATTLANNSNTYKSIVGAQLGDWKAVANNKDAVAVVKYDMSLQSAALTPVSNSKIIVPEGYKPRGGADVNLDTRTEGDLRLKKDGEIRDDFIFRPEKTAPKKPENSIDFDPTKKEDFSAVAEDYNRSIASSNYGSEVKVNNFKPGEQEAAKAEYFRLHPEERPNGAPLDIDLTQMENDAALKSVDVDLNKLEADALVAQALRRPPAVIKPLAVVAPTPQQRQALETRFTENSSESLRNVDRISANLEERREGAASRLLEKGLTKLSSGLEMFSKVSPRKKAAIGLLLAGASVATGGATSVLSKGLSTMSFASSHYNEKLKANEAAGIETNKKKLAVQSVARGFILAMATSQLISILTENISMPAVIDSAVEKVSGVKDTIKEWFSGLTSSINGGPAIGLPHDPNAINGLILSSEPVNPLDLTADPASAVDAAVGSQDMLAPLSAEYMIKPGDNLTNIMRTEVLSKIPGIESLTPGQQNNMIENYLKEAAKYKDISFFDSVNQFANPNLIQPDDKLDLEKMRQGMMSFKFPELGGQTLFDHAKTVVGSTGGSSVASAAFSSVVEGTPTGATLTGADIFNDLGATSDSVGGQGELRPDAALEPSQIIEEGEDVVDEGAMDTRETAPFDDSTDSPRIQGQGYRNNA